MRSITISLACWRQKTILIHNSGWNDSLSNSRTSTTKYDQESFSVSTSHLRNSKAQRMVFHKSYFLCGTMCLHHKGRKKRKQTCLIEGAILYTPWERAGCSLVSEKSYFLVYICNCALIKQNTFYVIGQLIKGIFSRITNYKNIC